MTIDDAMNAGWHKGLKQANGLIAELNLTEDEVKSINSLFFSLYHEIDDWFIRESENKQLRYMVIPSLFAALTAFSHELEKAVNACGGE